MITLTGIPTVCSAQSTAERLPVIAPMDNPELWRKRAEEVRLQAEQISDGKARRGMLAVAEGYERMAERIEQRIAERRTLSGDNE